ncbi:hypothetical protein GCM10027084_08250 [Pseudoxanthomonas sangjuensis]|uniref:glycoside hydrolase family 16 protein n=1 Tax=Pseudoxanthomonas sangjuensis TaxID=1503750 RepID=UPI001391ACD1|nr:glycoside hydrolase family 16 protein [Pseudoxanthomonas sangjuensis]KAF1710259.1 glycoside hydrolase [Pseudoxanthomonas sangjuensis]
MKGGFRRRDGRFPAPLRRGLAWSLAALGLSLACVDAATAAAQWKLVWSDEFDYRGLPDPAKWNYEEGFVRNNEAQYYTRARKENAWVEDGMLVIETRRERYRGAQYTSASVTTEARASWRYGRVEVRARLPTGRGLWPAIWMMGSDRPQVGWPACGEIDIMENVGFDPDRVHATIHTPAFNGGKGTQKSGNAVVAAPYREFHVYALEWFPDRLDFFVDGQKIHGYANSGKGSDEWPYDKPFYLLINTALGGGWGGQQGIDDAALPQRYYIDYVRVYRRAGSGPEGDRE